MATPFRKIHGVLRVSSVYTCANCGNQEAGIPTSIEIYCENSASVKDTLDEVPQTSYTMPIGWAYHGKFTCSRECTAALYKGETP
jgi:hypothetical protein